jgi:hypothetical protein
MKPPTRIAAGAFALPLPWTLGLVEPPRDLVSADGSATYWEVGKTVRQALRADPNTLEMLFVPGAKALDPIGEWLLDARDAFVSVEIYETFGRYAIGQLRRLEQSSRLAEHRSLVLDWLRADPSLSLDGVSSRLAAAALDSADSDADRLHRAKQYVKQLYRSLHDQGLLDANEFAALVRFARDQAAAFELPRELRPKNAYNLLRLIATASGWLRDGHPSFRADGPLRDRLFAVKKGDVALAEVVAEAEVMVSELDEAKASSRLPGRPDIGRADALLRRIGEELASRWTKQERGPFGLDAPLPPEVVWND